MLGVGAWLTRASAAFVGIGGLQTAVAQTGNDPLQCITGGDSVPSVGVYDFVFDNTRTLCVAPKEDADGTLMPCLRIGRIYIGQARDEVEKETGSPGRAFGDAGYAYLVYRDTIAEEGAYYAVEYERVRNQDVAAAIQLTGDPTPTGLHFSCLRLGDPEADVRRQLGLPAGTTPFDAPEAGVSGTRWEYRAPFSIEIVNGRVFGFRVWRPRGVPAGERTLSLLRRP